MIQFRQKHFSEYDAMRSLYVELMKMTTKDKFGIIDQKALIPILRGNNVVIERFVISTYVFGRDKYRMYLKVGAKAKMPDEVRLPSTVYDKTIANITLNIGSGGDKNNQQGGENEQQKNFSGPVFKMKMFGKGGKGKGNGNGISGKIGFSTVFLQHQVKELLGDALEYNKKERSLVLEFKSIQDAIRALNILPFGINYKIYLLS